MVQDYYELLGVERSATPQEIKKAFRKKALEHHPDRADDPSAAEEKFKEINAAYAVLSDSEKRAAYDRFGSEGFHQHYSREDIFRGFDASSFADILGDLGFGGDLFSRIFGGRPGAGQRGFRVEFATGDPFGGSFNGAGQSGATKGSDMEAELQITFAEAVGGSERQFSYALPGSGTRTLKVTIPPDSRDGSKLRLRGQGDPAPAGGQPGDLYLVLTVEPHSRIAWRDERDLEVDVPVDLLDLVLGGGAVVPTLRDGDKRIKIRPGTQPGTPIRLRGFGVPANGSHPAGDLYAIVRLTIPEKLSAEQTRLFEQLRESGL